LKPLNVIQTPKANSQAAMGRVKKKEIVETCFLLPELLGGLRALRDPDAPEPDED